MRLALAFVLLASLFGCSGLGWFAGANVGGGFIDGNRGDYDTGEVGVFFGLTGGFGAKSPSRPIPVYVVPVPEVEVVEDDVIEEEDIPHHHHTSDTLDEEDEEDPSTWFDDWGPAGVVIAGLLAIILGLIHAVKPEWTTPVLRLLRRLVLR